MSSETGAADNEILPEGELLRLNDWSGLAAWILACLAFLLGVFLLVSPPSQLHHFDGSLRPVLGLIWLSVGLMIAGGARSGLIVDQQGITVQGLIRRTHFNWSEVALFELKTPFYKAALRIHLINGRELNTLGFGAKSPGERRLAEARVAELNRRASAPSREN